MSAFVGDNAGNSYVALQGYRYADEGGEEDGSQLRKYDTTGKLLWQRDFDDYEANFQDLAVGSDGSLYGVSGGPALVLTRYSASGATLWQVSTDTRFSISVAVGGNAVYVAAANRNIYADAETLLTKYNAAGARQWQRAIAPSTHYNGISTDTAGNVYVVGDAVIPPIGEGGLNLLVRKYTASGALSWTYQPKLPGTTEYSEDVAVRNAGEIYTVGSADSKVNGTNNGGFDAYVLRLNAQGQKVWSR